MDISPFDTGFKMFLVSYRYEGADWNVEIPALSQEDAERRVSALSSAKCDGQVVTSLPVPKGIPSPLQVIKRMIPDSFWRI